MGTYMRVPNLRVPLGHFSTHYFVEFVEDAEGYKFAAMFACTQAVNV